MRFSGQRQVPGTVDLVWASLHDHDVLRCIIPGCTQMCPLDDGTYSATMQARVGRIADTYRGTFSVADVRPGTELRVRVGAGGRFGQMEVDLYVTLAAGPVPATTTLRYDAEATVGGLVSRAGTRTLSLAGGHFTGCFFRALERRIRRSHAAPAV